MNAYTGSNALKDFLDPEKQPYTPLVEIPTRLNSRKIRVYAKQQQMNPLYNVKALPAAKILQNARLQGDTSDTLAEFSSGNMATSLSVLGRLYGYTKTVACVSHLCCQGILNQLRFFGAHPLVNKEPKNAVLGSSETGQQKIKVLAKENHWYNTNQCMCLSLISRYLLITNRW